MSLLSLIYLATLPSATAIETDAEYLRRKISVAYLHEAAATPPQWDTISPEDIDNGTTASPFFSSREVAPFRNLTSALFRPGTTDGVPHARFQNMCAQIISMRDNPIVSLLINDVNSLVPSSPRFTCQRTDDGHAAPTAIRNTVAGNPFGGTISFGLSISTSRGDRSTLSRYAHYLVHTQDRSVPHSHYDEPATVQGSTVWVVNSDNGILTAEASALYFQMRVDPQHFNRIYNWWRQPDNEVWFRNSRSAETPSDSQDASLLGTTLLVAGAPRATGNTLSSFDRNYNRFRVSSVTADVMSQLEPVVGMVFYMCAQQGGSRGLRQATRGAVLRRSNNPPSILGGALQYISEDLNGGSLSTAIRADQAAKALLPFAYIDYFTRFGCRDKNDFKRMLGMRIVDDTAIDSYFDHGFREKLRQGAASTPNNRDFDMILHGLNIT
jgi:hypothetical protein